MNTKVVFPAKAGIHFYTGSEQAAEWIPTFAGTTSSPNLMAVPIVIAPYSSQRL
jgi:hypothetical protein